LVNRKVFKFDLKEADADLQLRCLKTESSISVFGFYSGYRNQLPQKIQTDSRGLKNIVTIHGWYLQFGYLPRLMWPLILCEVAVMKVEKLERLFSSYFKKWLCLPPRPLSSIGLYGKGILELPISSLTEEYKCAKGRLEMMLTESVDLVVAQVVPILMTGWTPSETTKLAKAALNSNSLLRLHPPTSDLTLSYGQHHSSSSTSSST